MIQPHRAVHERCETTSGDGIALPGGKEQPCLHRGLNEESSATARSSAWAARARQSGMLLAAPEELNVVPNWSHCSGLSGAWTTASSSCAMT